MTEIYKAKCDRCGKEENLIEEDDTLASGHYIYRLPNSWTEARVSVSDNTVDLCASCKEKLDSIEKNFIEQKLHSSEEGDKDV